MALTPTKRHLNWTGTIWTPIIIATGLDGTPNPWTGVQNIEIDPRGQVVAHSGDGDIFPTLKAFVESDPQITVTFRDLAALHQATPSQRGSLTSTHNDAKNAAGAGGGAYSLTLANAMIENTPSGGQHKQLGEGRAVVSAESEDGITSPLTFTAA